MDDKVCDKYCHDCKYFQGFQENVCCCNYILIESKHRGCDPGTGCTKKVKRKKKRRMNDDRKQERKNEQ